MESSHITSEDRGRMDDARFRTPSGDGAWANPARMVRQGSGFLDLPLWVWGVALVVVIWALTTPNALFTAVTGLLLPVMVRLLWIDGEPPVLLFAAFMQLLQASAAVFYANLKGIPLANALELGGSTVVEASWLSLAGVGVVTIGMRLALIGRRPGIPRHLDWQSHVIDPVRIFKMYLISFPFFAVVELAAFGVPGLTQVLLTTVLFKWVLLFLLMQSVLKERRHFTLLVSAVCIEFFSSLFAYFSDFKSIFFMLAVALPTARYIFRGRRIIYFCLLAVLALGFGVIWTAVKKDYRDFVNQGSHEQVVSVSRQQGFGELVRLVGEQDWAQLGDAFDNLLLRISYVEFFAQTLENVPENVPHTNGRLWFDATTRIFRPRILFPQKESIDDSERTAYYTGQALAGAEFGTSISIGYMGESYIDFGRIGMFVPILLLGLFYGLIYRVLVDYQRLTLLGCAMATSILLFGAYTIETSNVKLIGGNFLGFIVMAFFLRYFGHPFWRMILWREDSKPRLRPKVD